MPRVLGVREIIRGMDGVAHRMRPPRVYLPDAEKSRTSCICSRASSKILLDIDKAIRIIRETEFDAEVVPNLMIGFGIDQVQAEYVAEIKLRNINKEYILQPHAGGRVAGPGDCRPGGRCSRSERKLRAVIVQGAGRRRREIRRGPQNRHHLRRTRAACRTRRRRCRTIPSRSSSPARAISRKSHRSRCGCPASRSSRRATACLLSRETTNSRRAAGLHRPLSGLQDAAVATLTTAKPPLLGDFLPAQARLRRGRKRRCRSCFPGDYSGNLLFVLRKRQGRRRSSCRLLSNQVQPHAS